MLLARTQGARQSMETRAESLLTYGQAADMLNLKIGTLYALVRPARSSFRIGRAKVSAVQGGAERWERRVARSIEPLGGCVG